MTTNQDKEFRQAAIEVAKRAMMANYVLNEPPLSSKAYTLLKRLNNGEYPGPGYVRSLPNENVAHARQNFDGESVFKILQLGDRILAYLGGFKHAKLEVDADILSKPLLVIKDELPVTSDLPLAIARWCGVCDAALSMLQAPYGTQATTMHNVMIRVWKDSMFNEEQTGLIRGSDAGFLIQISNLAK